MKNNLIKKSITNNNNSNNNYWPENPSFIFSDLCYCGHKSNEHSPEDSKCSKYEFCKCMGFLS